MPRKISEQAATRFANGNDWKLKNTEVKDGQLFLHGNKIAWWVRSKTAVCITMAGWPTVTTCERLNTLLGHLGTNVSISRSQGNTVLSFWINSGDEHYQFEIDPEACITIPVKPNATVTKPGPRSRLQIKIDERWLRHTSMDEINAVADSFRSELIARAMQRGTK